MFIKGLEKAIKDFLVRDVSSSFKNDEEIKVAIKEIINAIKNNKDYKLEFNTNTDEVVNYVFLGEEASKIRKKYKNILFLYTGQRKNLRNEANVIGIVFEKNGVIYDLSTSAYDVFNFLNVNKGNYSLDVSTLFYIRILFKDVRKYNSNYKSNLKNMLDRKNNKYSKGNDVSDYNYDTFLDKSAAQKILGTDSYEDFIEFLLKKEKVLLLNSIYKVY